MDSRSETALPTTTPTWSACSSTGGTTASSLRRDPGERAGGLPGHLLDPPLAGVSEDLDQGCHGERQHRRLQHLHAAMRGGDPICTRTQEEPPRKFVLCHSVLPLTLILNWRWSWCMVGSFSHWCCPHTTRAPPSTRPTISTPRRCRGPCMPTSVGS